MMAMAIRSPQIYPATSPRMPHGTPAHTSRPASHDAGLPTPSRPALHDAGLPTPGTARMPQRRKSVDFVRQVEVRDYEVEPFDFSDSADCTDKGAGQASPQLSALTESPRMQPLKPEGPVGPVPSAPRLLQRPTIRSPRLPVQTPRLPVSSPPFSPAGPQSSSVTPEMLPWSREPHEPPPMESTDVGIAEQRLNLNRSPGHEALMFESAQMAQREVQRLIEEETMRMEWEGQQPVQNGGVRMHGHGQHVTSQIMSQTGSLNARKTDKLDYPDSGRLSAISTTSTSTEIISVEEILRMGFQEDGNRVQSHTSKTPIEEISVESILSMWGAPRVENVQAPAAPSPYPSEASTNALFDLSKMRLQEAEESFQRLELLQKVSACVSLNFRAQVSAVLTS